MKLPLHTTLDVFEKPETMAVALADRLTARVGEIAARQAAVCLALPREPALRPALEQLADPKRRQAAPWEQVKVFFTNEGSVGPDDPASSFALAWSTWLKDGPVARRRIWRMEGEAPDLKQAAFRYEQWLGEQVAPGPTGFPRLDLILLDLGEDGRVAGLWPKTDALEETLRAVAAKCPAGAIIVIDK